MPSAKQQPSNIKHGSGIRPNVCTLNLVVHTTYMLHGEISIQKDYSASTVSSLSFRQLRWVKFHHPFRSTANRLIQLIAGPFRSKIYSASSINTSFNLFLDLPLDLFPCLGFHSSWVHILNSHSMEPPHSQDSEYAILIERFQSSYLHSSHVPYLTPIA